MLEAVTLDTAQNLILSHMAKRLLSTEEIPLCNAVGRIIDKDILSSVDLPAFFRSTVDGYAVRAADTFGASEGVPALFKLLGKAHMGEPNPYNINKGEAVYVPTGAMLPTGADAMVMLEYTDAPSSDELFVYKPACMFDNTITKGEDVKLGERVMSRGATLTPLMIGMLASLGKTKISVFRKLKLSVISSGNEIVPADAMPNLCQIRDTNAPLISAMLSPVCNTISTSIIKDDPTQLTDTIGNALKDSDIVILSGGSSVGEQDYTYRAICAHADDVYIKGISLKPGKPTMAAYTKDGKLIFGLAGHTMAAAITCNLLILKPLLSTMGATERLKTVLARTSGNFPSAAGRTTIIPVTLTLSEDGYIATPLFSKSGLISRTARADGYVLTNDKTEGIYANQKVEVHLL